MKYEQYHEFMMYFEKLYSTLNYLDYASTIDPVLTIKLREEVDVTKEKLITLIKEL